MNLMVIILTYNEARHIQDCIASCEFADRVLVFDSYSTDNTVTLAEQAGAEVMQNPFEDYAQQRNAALEAVEGQVDWVLFVDADERVTPELADEVCEVIHLSEYDAWQIPRYNYIFGKLTRATGWYPDHQIRLMRVGSAAYDPARKVHEVVRLARGDAALGTMTGHFLHYNYDNARQFAYKQRKYARYEARILYEEGIRPRPRNYILQPLRIFKWRFVTWKGYRDGVHGLRLSLLMGWYEFKKYVYLRQMWQEEDGATT